MHEFLQHKIIHISVINRTLPLEHSAILSTFIKLPFVIKIFVLSIFEWPFITGFTLSFLQVVMTIIALFCVDKFGRRKFLLTGAILMGISILTLGIVCRFEQSGIPSKSCIDQTNCKNIPGGNLNNYTNITLNFTGEPANATKNPNTHSVTLSHNQSGFTITTASVETDHVTSQSQSNATKSNTHSVIKRDSPPVVHTDSGTTPRTNVSDSQGTKDGGRYLMLKITGFSALMTYVAAYGFSFGPG